MSECRSVEEAFNTIRCSRSTPLQSWSLANPVDNMGKHGHKHKHDVEEPLLLQRTGATVANQANATLNYRLLHNPKFRALLVQSVRVLDAR